MSQTSPLDYRRLPSYKPLFLDYLHRFEALAPFFAGNPFEPASWKRVASELAASERNATEVARALTPLNASLGADEAALGSLEALEGGALAVVTGQQVGLFGGPLYSLYKALTAVVLARNAAKALGRRVVPLFWMDADDHDFAEVQSASILSPSYELLTLRYEDADEAASRRPVGARPLSAEIEPVLDAAFGALPESEYRAAVLEAAREAYAPGHTMAEAFGSWLLRLTRGTGLAVVDPTLAVLKAQGKELFAREIAEGSESSRIVEKTTAELLARGYHAQATPAPSHFNLFYANPDRYHVARDDGGVLLAEGSPVVTREEAARRVSEEPARFSPNVLLRPLYQDTLLPTLAYVAGPNELAYFAQLKGLYEHFGIVMPLIASRASFTIVERPQARFLERYGVEITKLKTDDESVLNEILKRHTPPQLDEDLSRARKCIEEITNALERDLAAVDQTLIPTVKTTRGKLLHHLKELETKSLRALKRKNDTVRQQFLATRAALFPGFEMQERKLSPLGYLAKHGFYFSTMVEESIDPNLKAHTLLYV